MEDKLTPGNSLLTKVRSSLIAKGTSLHRWCSENDVLYPNARQALIGSWNGPKGTALREKIIHAAGLCEVDHE
ncbi:TPA: hypothetical protein ACSP3H_001030 [Aeromonas veronii]